MSEEKDFVKRLEHLLDKVNIDLDIYIVDYMKKNERFPTQKERNKYASRRFFEYLAQDFGVKF
jgi:hypothetical protein